MGDITTKVSISFAFEKEHHVDVLDFQSNAYWL